MQPFALAETVRNDYRRYIKTTFPIADPVLAAEVDRQIDHGDLLWKGPYITLARAFASGERPADLVAEGLLHPGTVNIFRHVERLHAHQSAAARRLIAGKNTIVATGTGSGKTEAFLVPIIDYCLRMKEQGVPGTKALLLYPMNALANDQRNRLRQYLAGSGITFARYTGDTQRTASGEGEGPSEEIGDRKSIRDLAPDILITNYAMLELLLVRKEDQKIFRHGALRFLVIDEVHTYKGAVGSEVACLIRRLKEHSNLGTGKLVCAGTSATVESPDQDQEAVERDVARFASNLFAEEFEAPGCIVREVYAEPHAPATPHWPAMPSITDAALTFGDVDDECAKALSLARALVGDSDGADLHGVEAFRETQRILSDNAVVSFLERELTAPRSLQELAVELARRPEREGIEATDLERELAAYLIAGSVAPEASEGAAGDEYEPRLKPKLHVFYRGIGNFTRCVRCGRLYTNGQPTCLECVDPQSESGDGVAAHCLPLEVCRLCGQDYFLGSLSEPLPAKQRERIRQEQEAALPIQLRDTASTDSQLALHFARHLHRLQEAAPEAQGEDEDGEDAPSDQDEEDAPQKAAMYGTWICPVCLAGYLFIPPGERCQQPGCGATLVTGQSLDRNIARCPACQGADGSNNVVTPVMTGTASCIAVLTTSVMSGLTHHDDPALDEQRLLIFTDNRQDTAFQTGYIADRQDRFSWRQLIYQITRDRAQAGEVPVDLRNIPGQILKYAVGSGIRREPASQFEYENELRMIVGDVLMEITRSGARRVNIEDLGLVEIGYGYSDSLLAKPETTALAEEVGLPAGELVDFARQLLDEFRHRRALSHDYLCTYVEKAKPGSPPGAFSRAPRFDRKPKGYHLTLTKEEAKDRGYPYALHRVMGGAHPSPFEGYAIAVLGKDNLPLARTLLAGAWNLLVDNKYLVQRDIGAQGNREHVHMVAEDRVEFLYMESAFRCTRCRRIFPRSVRGACPTWRCTGRLRPLDADDPEIRDNYYAHMYRERAPVPIRAAEHSGQIKGTQREKYEDDFRTGNLNVLVCTPTMELGVDIGQLVTLILRNVPPSPANYAQRSGRAGRRYRLAVVHTYCQQGPHDRYFYEDPERMVRGVIRPPVFMLDNDRVIRRHIRSLVLEKLPEDHLDGRMARYLDADTNLTGLDGLYDDIALKEDTIVEAALVAFEPDIDRGRLRQFDRASVEQTVRNFRTDLEQTLFPWVARVRDLRERLDALPKYGLTNDQKKERAALEAAEEAITRSERAYPLRFLAELGFLPSYAFPGEQVELDAPKDVGSLARAQEIAIEEYAPGNIVYVNGSKLKVTGASFRRSGDTPGAEGDQRVYKECANPACDTVSFNITDQYCPNCKEEYNQFPYIVARAFRARDDGRIDASEEARSRRGYDAHRYIVDEGTGPRLIFDYPDTPMTYLRRGRVFIANTGFLDHKSAGDQRSTGFHLCEKCGDWWDKPVSGKRVGEPEKDFQKRHRDLFKCTGNVSPFDLGVEMECDCLLIDVDPPGGASPAFLATLRNALLLGTRLYLEADVGEISGFDRNVCYATESAEGGAPEDRYAALHQIVLYETVPGGAGYLERAAAAAPHVASTVLALLESCSCEGSCYECLRTYSNQREHGLLDKQLIVPFLRQLATLEGTAGREESLQESSYRRDHELKARREYHLRMRATDRTESEIEDMLLGAMRDLSLPEPQQQYEVSGEDGRLISRADFAYPNQKLLVYCDGWRWHGNREAWEKDVRQTNLLQRQGWMVLRYTGSRIFRDAGGVAREVSEVLKTALQRP